MNKKYIFNILIFFLIVITLSSYYLGKTINYNSNPEILKVEEYIKIGNYGVKEFKQKIEENYILVDIRTPSEIEKGYIEGLDFKIDYYKDNFKSEIEKLDKTKKYLIYCRSGSRTGNALYLMKNLGFRNVHDLKGGIGEWERLGEGFIK